jgi:hypothetical protein
MHYLNTLQISDESLKLYLQLPQKRDLEHLYIYRPVLGQSRFWGSLASCSEPIGPCVAGPRVSAYAHQNPARPVDSGTLAPLSLSLSLFALPSLELLNS